MSDHWITKTRQQRTLFCYPIRIFILETKFYKLFLKPLVINCQPYVVAFSTLCRSLSCNRPLCRSLLCRSLLCRCLLCRSLLYRNLLCRSLWNRSKTDLVCVILRFGSTNCHVTIKIKIAVLAVENEQKVWHKKGEKMPFGDIDESILNLSRTRLKNNISQSLHFFRITILNVQFQKSLQKIKPWIFYSKFPTVNFINVYEHVFRTKFWHQSWNVSRKNWVKGRSYENFVHKTMMKLTPGGNPLEDN